MPDSAAYNAGYLRSQAQQQHWASAVGNAVRTGGRLYGEIDSLISTYQAQTNEKITRAVNQHAVGVDGEDGQRLTGFMETAYQNGYADPENMKASYDTQWKENVTLENIIEWAQVSEKEAQRWLNDVAPDMKVQYDEYADEAQKTALDSIVAANQTGLGNVLSTDPNMDFTEFERQYGEAMERAGLDDSTALGYSVSLNNPSVRAGYSYNHAMAATKSMIEERLKKGYLLPEEAEEYAISLFDSNVIDTNEPRYASAYEEFRKQIKTDVASSISELSTKIVNDSATRMTAGSGMISDIWRQDPEHIITDEEFEDLVINRLGMDPDGNSEDRRNAEALYETVKNGNSLAADTMILNLVSDPDVNKRIQSEIDSAIASAMDGGNVERRVYSITDGMVTTRDAEGNAISGTYNPQYRSYTYTPSSAALDSIYRTYDAMQRRTAGAETIISTDYGGIIDLLPEEVKGNPEAFQAAVEYINNRGNTQTTLYSESMANKAVNIANATSLTEQEKRDKIEAMYVSGQIDQAARSKAMDQVDFAYQEDKTAVLNQMEALIGTYGDAVPDNLYDQISSDLGVIDNLEKWIISWRTAGQTLSNQNPAEFINSQISLFMGESMTKEFSKEMNEALVEMYGREAVVGRSSAFDVRYPAQLVQMADEGRMPLIVDNPAIEGMRQQMALGDSSLTTSMDDLKETGAQLMFSSGYEDLSDYQRRIVDINATLAVADQYDFSMLHQTFIEGQGLEGYSEVKVKTGDGRTTVGLLGSDGYVYFLPNYDYGESQTADMFYVGTQSQQYLDAMAGDSVTFDISSYDIESYRRPTQAELNRMWLEQSDMREGPESWEDWREYIKIIPKEGWRSAHISIDSRLWDVIDDETYYRLLNAVANDPDYKQFYVQIESEYANWGANKDSILSKESITPGRPAPDLQKEYSILNDAAFNVAKQNAKDRQIRRDNA